MRATPDITHEEGGQGSPVAPEAGNEPVEASAVEAEGFKRLAAKLANSYNWAGPEGQAADIPRLLSDGE